jgi:methyl-accepting chemotaxis protein
LDGLYSKIERGIQGRFSYRRSVIIATLVFVGAIWVIFITAIIFASQFLGKANELEKIEYARQGCALFDEGVETQREALPLALSGEAAAAATTFDAGRDAATRGLEDMRVNAGEGEADELARLEESYLVFEGFLEQQARESGILKSSEGLVSILQEEASLSSDLRAAETAYLGSLSTEALSIDNELQRAFRLTLILSIVIIFLAALIGVAFAFLMYRWVTRPINLITDQVGRIAAGDGDLTQQVIWENKGVLGGLAESINLMIRALRGSIAEIGKIAGALSINAEQMASVVQQMNSSSQEVSSTVSHIAKGSEEQARRVMDTSHAMENMSGTVQEIAGKAELSNAASMEAIEIATRGVEAALETANAIEAINTAAQVVVNTSEGLEARFMQIGIIVDVITSVADQTNLLALNAAIEAARAGEHGRGFAVVADEVRKLAEDSRKAAEQISHLIGEIQSEVTRMTDNINRSVKEVAKGTEVVERTGTALREITISVQRTSQYADEIADTTRTQVESSEEVLRAITEIAGIADEVAASSEESAAAVQEQTASMQEITAAAQELAEMANRLNKVVGGFRVI